MVCHGGGHEVVPVEDHAVGHAVGHAVLHAVLHAGVGRAKCLSAPRSVRFA